MAQKTVYQILLEIAGDQQAKESFQSLARDSQELGKILAATGASLTAFLGLGSKINAEVEQGLAFLGTVTGETTAELDAYNTKLDQVIESSGGLASRTDLLAGAYQAASGGIRDQATNLALLEGSAKLATVGQAEQAEVVQATIAAYKQLGDTLPETLSESEKLRAIQERLLLVQNEGITTVGQLASGYGQIAPVAAATGISLNELNAALATVTASGVGTSEAVTSLKAVFSGLARGGATDTAKEILAEAGVEFNLAAIEAKGFQGVLTDLNDAGLNTSDVLIEIFGGSEALNAIQPLLTNSTENFTKQLGLQSGELDILDENFKRVSETTEGQFIRVLNQLREATGNIAQGIGTAVKPFLSLLAEALELFNKLPAPIQATIGVSVAAVAGFTTLAGALVFLAGTVGNLIPGLITVASSLKSLTVAAATTTPAITATSLQLQLLTTSAGASAFALTNTGNAAKVASTQLKVASAALKGIAGIGVAAALAAIANEWNAVAKNTREATEAGKAYEEALKQLRLIQALGNEPEPGEGEDSDPLQNLVDQNLAEIEESRNAFTRLADAIRGEGGKSTDATLRRLSEAFFGSTLASEELIQEIGRTNVGSLPDDELEGYITLIDEAITRVKNQTATTRSQAAVQVEYINRLEATKTELQGTTETTESLTAAGETQALTAEEQAEAQAALVTATQEATAALREQAATEQASTSNRLQAGKITEIQALNENLKTQADLTRGLVKEERALARNSEATTEDRIAARERVTQALEEGAAKEAEINRKIRETENALFDQGIEQAIAKQESLVSARIISEEEGAARVNVIRRVQLQDELGRIQQEIEATKEGSLARAELVTQAAKAEAEILELQSQQRQAALDGFLSDVEAAFTQIEILADTTQSRLNNALSQTQAAGGFVGDLSGLFDDLGGDEAVDAVKEQLEGLKADLASEDADTVARATQQQEELNVKLREARELRTVENGLALDLAQTLREQGIIQGEINTIAQAREAISRAQIELKVREITLQNAIKQNELDIQRIEQQRIATEQTALLESGTLGDQETRLAQARLQAARDSIGLLENQRSLNQSNLETELAILRTTEQIAAAREAGADAAKAANDAGAQFDSAAGRASKENAAGALAQALNPLIEEQAAVIQESQEQTRAQYEQLPDDLGAALQDANTGLQEGVNMIPQGLTDLQATLGEQTQALGQGNQEIVNTLTSLNTQLDRLIQANQTIPGSLSTLGDRIQGGINGVRSDLGAIPGAIGSAVARSIPRPAPQVR